MTFLTVFSFWIFLCQHFCISVLVSPCDKAMASVFACPSDVNVIEKALT